MKIITSIFVLFILTGCQPKQSYQVSVDSLQSNEKNIILMHPTVNNIRTFEYLVTNKIFPLPQGYKAIGVYHSLEEYNYSNSEDYLEQKGITNVLLVRIDAELNPNNIFKNNYKTHILHQT